MERRFIVFLVVAFGMLMAYNALMVHLHPPKPRNLPGDQVAAKDDEQKGKAPADAKKAEKEKGAAEKPETKKAEAKKKTPAVKPAPEQSIPEQYVTLGSADPSSENPFRMLVLLTNKGAAVARIELNRYFDVDDRRGYLGHITAESNAQGNGLLVQFVGPGTPAAEAGLQPGDWLKSFNDTPITDQQSLEDALKNTKPKQEARLAVLRKGKEVVLAPVKLRRRPLEAVRPENNDPLSMLLTLQQIDDLRLSDVEKKDDESFAKEKHDDLSQTDLEKLKAERYLKSVRRELEGVNLRSANWKLVESDAMHAKFSQALPESGLEIVKTYRLTEAPAESAADANFPAYHLEFEIEIRNIDEENSHKVAYRLDGPNGLPTEGDWYATKVSRNWKGGGLRDFIVSFGPNVPEMIGPATIIAEGKDTGLKPRPDTPPSNLMTYIGVDAQYFSVVMLPQRNKPEDVWFEELLPIRVGKVAPSESDLKIGMGETKRINLTNVSCRLISYPKELKPGGSMTHKFRVFAGPKKPAILANPEYNLSELIYYGWPVFAMFAKPLTWLLHLFHSVTFNYGLAIILLTVLVRCCMFPLSLKQAAGAQKMQMIQPELKKILEKHKNSSEARAKAQQELFRKHNYNPLSGCLPIFIQMPVFIGLYRSLMVDIELRDASLISQAIRWCSNLAAPDMLFYWGNFMPRFIIEGAMYFPAFGPYFNIMPIFAIALMVIQQKMFMPPPTDEQSAMQQKMMKYMMIFMGVLFFKVASGLCIYFIISSLWGLIERQFLPKPITPTNPSGPETRADAKARARELATKNKK